MVNINKKERDLSKYRSIEVFSDNDIPEPILRIDFFLHAVITGEQCELLPTTRAEEYLYTLATGEHFEFENPRTILEMYLDALVKGDTSDLPKPRTVSETLLYQAVTGEDLGVEPVSRMDKYLSLLQKSGGLDYILSTSTNPTVIPLPNSINGSLEIDEMCGNTMVNVCDQQDSIPSNQSHVQLKYLSPNKEYVVQFESDNTGTLVVNLGGDSPKEISVVEGRNKVNILARDHDYFINYIYFDGIGCNISNIVVTEAVNEDFGYFQGMKSVGEVEGNKIEVKSSVDGQDKSNIQTIQLSEPLRGLPNGVCDKIVKIDGQWHVERNCIKVTIPNNLYGTIDTITETTITFKISNPLFASLGNGSIAGRSVITDKYAEAMSVIQNIVWIKVPKSVATTYAEFQKYLPMTFVSPLITPTYESLEMPKIKCYNNTTVYINSGAIPPTKTVIKYPYKVESLF